MHTDDDLTLLRRFAAERSDQAFAELVRRHGTLVRDTCRRRLRDPAAADDAAQAVLLILARKAASLGRRPWWGRPVIADWLHRTAGLVCANHERQRRRRERHEREASMSMTDTRSGSIDAELRGRVDAALADLPARYRQPLMLHYLEGLERHAVAAQLGLGEEALRKRLQRGLEALRRRLGASSEAGVAVLLASSAGGEAESADAVLGYLKGGAVPESVSDHVVSALDAMRAAARRQLLAPAAAVLVVAGGLAMAVAASDPSTILTIAQGSVVPAPAVARAALPSTQLTPAINRMDPPSPEERESAAMRRALDYLVAHQRADGAIVDGETMTVATTACAILGIDAAERSGLAVDHRVRATAISWLAAYAQAHPKVIKSQGTAPMYEHALALLALATHAGEIERGSELIGTAVEVILKAQNQRGGWRYNPVVADDDLSVSGYQVLALCAARDSGAEVPAETLRRAAKYLGSCQDQASGGFAYAPGGEVGLYRTALGTLALQRIGDPLDAKAVDAGVRWLAREWPEEQVLFRNLAFHFVAEIEGKPAERADWRSRMVPELLAAQGADGGVIGPYTLVNTAFAIETLAPSRAEH